MCDPYGKEKTCAKDTARQIAREQKDRFLEAAALVSLGNAYRLTGDYEQAIEYLEGSLKLANEINNPVYRASALNSLGNAYTSLAKVNYRRANSAEQIGDSIKAEELRKQAVSDDSKAVQYFQESIEVARTQNDVQGQMRALALKQGRIDEAGVGNGTAVFSSIILNDRTAILVSLPNGEKRFAWINIDSKSLRQEINEFRRGLERFSDIVYDSKPAQKLYDWIVRPFASDLDSAKIKTLVFIQDGILRSIPMAALHDGEKFLVQKYAIATTPSLTLTNPKTLNRQGMRALAVGLTKDAYVDGRKFPALTNVGPEISQIQTQIPGSKRLLNENFTRDRLQQELSQTIYPILHIATHGEFGTVPEEGLSTLEIAAFQLSGRQLQVQALQFLAVRLPARRQFPLLFFWQCHAAQATSLH